MLAYSHNVQACKELDVSYTYYAGLLAQCASMQRVGCLIYLLCWLTRTMCKHAKSWMSYILTMLAYSHNVQACKELDVSYTYYAGLLAQCASMQRVGCLI